MSSLKESNIKRLCFSDGNKEPVTKIRVMADYGATTWDHNGWVFCLSDIGVPPELCMKFEKWESEYFAIMDRLSSKSHCASADSPFLKFDQTGRALAQELKQFVGADIVVTFVDETENNEVALEYLGDDE